MRAQQSHRLDAAQEQLRPQAQNLADKPPVGKKNADRDVIPLDHELRTATLNRDQLRERDRDSEAAPRPGSRANRGNRRNFRPWGKWFPAELVSAIIEYCPVTFVSYANWHGEIRWVSQSAADRDSFEQRIAEKPWI